MSSQRRPHRIRTRPAATSEWDSFQAVLGVAYTVQQEFKQVRHNTAAALDALASKLAPATVLLGYPDSLARIVSSALNLAEADGAAIAIGDAKEMTCIARAGRLAPPLGSGLNAQTGLGGECIRTHEDVICVNTAADPRVDYAASNALGVRSVAYLPLLSVDDKLVGLMGVFSSHSGHFSHRDLATLRWIQCLVLDALTGEPNRQVGISTMVPGTPARIEAGADAAGAAKTGVTEEVVPLNPFPQISGDSLQPPADLEFAPQIVESGRRLPMAVAITIICMFLAGVGFLSYSHFLQPAKQSSLAAVAPAVRSAAVPASTKKQAPEFVPEPVDGLPNTVRMNAEASRVLTTLEVPTGAAYEGFALYGPNRVYFDVSGVNLAPLGAAASVSSDLVSRIRISEFQTGVTRIVFDLKSDAPFHAKAVEQGGMLSIDLMKAAPGDPDAVVLRPGKRMKIISTSKSSAKPL